MAKKKRRSPKTRSKKNKEGLHPDTKASIIAIGAIGFAAILLLAAFAKAGPAGD